MAAGRSFAPVPDASPSGIEPALGFMYPFHQGLARSANGMVATGTGHGSRRTGVLQGVGCPVPDSFDVRAIVRGGASG
jgi:hypothetical protein